MAILVDRAAGHRGPSAAWKPFGDVLRLPVSPDWLQTLRERLLRGYDHPVLRKKKSSKPVLTYLERQSTTRRLTNESHAGVVEGLERLAADGLVEFTVETFGTPAGKAMPFEEQIAIISRTDVRELPLHPLGSCSLC